MGHRTAHLSYWSVVGLALIVGFTLLGSTAIASAGSVPTTTTLTPAPSTAFASAPNNIVVLTAQVTGAGATGTVTFQDGAAALVCAGGNPATLTSGSAVCSTSFSTEGIHSLSANYSGDTTFNGSTATANEYIQNHATNLGTTYCNSGPIASNGSSSAAFSNTSPYPSVIFVGDGVNTDITTLVTTLSVQLKNLSSADTSNLHMLVVSPDGAHAFDFWSNAGSSVSLGNFTLIDGASQLPATGAISPGSYGPGDHATTPETFAPGPPSPAPQIPAIFASAAPFGASTFQTAFDGATAHGAWSLYVWDGSGTAATTSHGWCLNITPSTQTSTTTSVSSSSNPASFNPSSSTASVTFTATVSAASGSGLTVSEGTVSFADGSTILGTSPVSNGQTMLTTSLKEGTHQIVASYHDAETGSGFGDSSGSFDQRVNAATTNPTSGSGPGPYTYCNTGSITVPGLGLTSGPAAPYPSNIFVTSLPGTVQSVTVFLNGFSTNDQGDLLSLLVGPGGNNLDFFSLTGSSNPNPPSPFNVAFSDTASGHVTGNLLSAGTFQPTSENVNIPYPQCPPNASDCASPPVGPPLPSNPFTPTNKAATAGTAILGNVNAAGVFGGTSASTYNGNGTWSLYLGDGGPAGNGKLTNLTGGWCVSLTENLPSVSVMKSHSDTFTQGEQAVPFTINITNNGPGATGDPTGGNSPLTVTDTLNSVFSYATFSGTGWSCSAVAQTVTCLSHSTVAQGASYAPLAINVNVSPTAAAGATVSNVVHVSGGGVTPITSQPDTVTISSAPVLAIQKSHSGTFTQGQPAQWNLAISNTATGSLTNGTVTVSDTLPAGFTLASFTSTGSEWSCSGTATVTCTTTAAISGGANSVITFTVNVPANSPPSVSNTAGAFGGGDLTHTNATNAAISTDTATVLQTQSAPTVVSFNVLFGAQEFNLIGSTRVRLPWDITGIQVVFSQPIAAANANSLTGVAATAFSGLGTNTLTWTVSPIPIGSFTTGLVASGANAIKNASGTALNNGTNFTQNFRVLWGDFNDDGVVSATDSVLVNNARSSLYNIFADLNGDGVVNATDVNIVRTRMGTSQP